MNASIVDLRYKMSEVLDALERRERVTILYHGKIKGTILPVDERGGGKVTEHPFFGMAPVDLRPVDKVMEDLRAGRHRAL
jgi:antitoxin (DNA-binding transcriptional repressor) of toxin-antitoxin stability system